MRIVEDGDGIAERKVPSEDAAGEFQVLVLSGELEVVQWELSSIESSHPGEGKLEPAPVVAVRVRPVDGEEVEGGEVEGEGFDLREAEVGVDSGGGGGGDLRKTKMGGQERSRGDGREGRTTRRRKRKRKETQSSPTCRSCRRTAVIAV